MAKQLHITIADNLSENILDLNLEGKIVVWREMLCEGPTTFQLGTPEFIALRTHFLNENYQVSARDYQEQFLSELEKLGDLKFYEEVILWFEFDLFSHINMLAAISHLIENKIDLPIYLVCSKKVKGEKESIPLSHLPLNILQKHYEQRIHLDQDDLEMANLMWQLYNGQNPQKLKNLIKIETNFEYLSSCIRAHIERFPNSVTGLNALEKNILKLINMNNITSMNQLLGYSLEYQGYYGYIDIQLQRVINKLQLFYEVKEDKIELTPEGNEALNGSRNFYRVLKNDEFLGGVNMYDFLYDSESHKILKL
jgi:hypothetical protein